MKSVEPELDIAEQQAFRARLDAATPRLVVTPALLALNIAVFIAMVAAGISVTGGRAEEYLRFGANFAPLTTGGEWWRVVSAAFVHFGIVHLAFNMWALWDSGRLTEKLYGNAWFAMLYLFAGACGSLGSMLWKQNVISAGASGAVFGVFGALLAYLARERHSIPAATFDHLRASTAVFVAYSLFYGFTQAGIDNAAHVGGLAGGFVMGLVMARPLDPAAAQRGGVRRALAAAAIAIILLPAGALLVPDTSRVYRQAMQLQKEIEWFAGEDQRLNTALRGALDQARRGADSDRLVAREIRTRLLPQWEAALARIAHVELDADAPARKNYDLLMRYAVARRDTIKALADYLETGNPAYERMIVELRSQADEALKRYRSRQK